MGPVAQSLRINYPELVSVGPDGLLTASTPTMWQVVKAVQELNLKVEDLGTSAAATNVENSSILSGILDWLKDKIIQAKEFVAERIRAKELCLEDVCIEKEQLKTLLQNAGLLEASPTPTPTLESTPTPSPTPAPESISTSTPTL